MEKADKQKPQTSSHKTDIIQEVITLIKKSVLNILSSTCSHWEDEGISPEPSSCINLAIP